MAYASHLPLKRVKAIVTNWCLQERQPLSRLFTSLPARAEARLALTEEEKQGIRTAGARVAHYQAWLTFLASKGIRVINRSELGYPAALSHYLPTSAQPLLLFTYGNLALLRCASVAIVGAQSAATEVVETARDVATLLAEAGLAVVTGLGKGVGRAVSDGALSARNGQVIAVLPVGIQHALGLSQPLMDAVRQERALLLSPFHPNSRFTPTQALARTRLIGALADILLVMEADETGVERDMASLALHHNKMVCVWDAEGGDNLSPAGNRALLETGGLPISDISDVLDLVDALRGTDTGQAPYEPGNPPLPEARADEAAATFNPDSTLELLARCGRVPEALMRRLGHRLA